MSGFYVSPGAYFRELDLTDRVQNISTSIGAAVIEADWGPANERVLCTSVEDYMAYFGKPKPKYLSNYTTMRMLEVTKRCYVTRVVKNALQGGLIFAKAPAAAQQITRTSLRDAAVQPNETGGAGSGYTVGDNLEVTADSVITPAQLRVDAVNGSGAITAATVINGGSFSAVPTDMPVAGQATGGQGSQAVFTFDWVQTTVTAPSNETQSVWAPMIIGEPDPVNTLIMSDDMIFCLYDRSPGDHDIRISLELNTTGDGGFIVAVYLGNSAQPVETFTCSLERRTDGFGKPMYIEDVIKRSTYVGAIVNEDFDGEITDALVDGNFARRRMAGGSFGDRVSSAEVMLGWELYRDPEAVDVNILINGGFTDPAVQQKMVDVASDRADCIAVLDMPSDKQAVNDAIQYRQNTGIEPGLGIDSSYAAIYTPDLRVYDPYNATELYIPPSGHAAASYAYTDKVTKVWFSPAGMKRGALNVRGVRHIYNQGARDAFAPLQINPVRVMPGSGTFFWGDSTLQSRPSSLQFVSVRRMMCFIEKSISITLLYFVFDPNDAILRATIRSVIQQFLQPIKIGRGIEDFEVVIDERNNPSYLTDEGVLNCDVYIKPILSTRIIQLNAVLTKSGASFSELIDSGITLG